MKISLVKPKFFAANLTGEAKMSGQLKVTRVQPLDSEGVDFIENLIDESEKKPDSSQASGQ